MINTIDETIIRKMKPINMPRKKGHCSHDGRSSRSESFSIEEDHTPNTDIFRHLQARQYGGPCLLVNQTSLVSEYVSQHVPTLMEEKAFEMGKINKIFTSHWLDDKQVAFGTKCNKLMVMDVTTGRQLHIPSLKSSLESKPTECPCGIHSIALNPSNTLFATGAEHTNDLAVYMLPTFDPVMVGEGGHTDWIFDMQWIDDEYIVTGSRDSKLALWRVEDENCDKDFMKQTVPDYIIKQPEISKSCEKAQKVRALTYHDDRKELAVLSLNAYFHLWDVETFTAKSCRKLFHTRENVCMALSKEKCLYAVGSQSHINLVDPRSPNTLTTVISKYRGGGVRSVSFRESVLTIGTGVGAILFFDITAGKYLESNCGHHTNLNVSRGWLLEDETYRDFFMDADYPSAIYTHQYDKSGTRLFAAGGPLPAGLWGNYAGLWQ